MGFFLFAPDFGNAVLIFHFRTPLKLDMSLPINGDSITMTWNDKLIIHAYKLMHLQGQKGARDNSCCFVLATLTGAWMAIMETLGTENPATHACAQGHRQAICTLHVHVTRTPSLHNWSAIVLRDTQVQRKMLILLNLIKSNFI